mgnify:CR=1 FL=1
MINFLKSSLNALKTHTAASDWPVRSFVDYAKQTRSNCQPQTAAKSWTAKGLMCYWGGWAWCATQCCRSDWPGLCFCCYQPRVLSANRVDLGFLFVFFINWPILPPPPSILDLDSSPSILQLSCAMLGTLVRYTDCVQVGWCFFFVFAVLTLIFESTT